MLDRSSVSPPRERHVLYQEMNVCLDEWTILLRLDALAAVLLQSIPNERERERERGREREP